MKLACFWILMGPNTGKSFVQSENKQFNNAAGYYSISQARSHIWFNTHLIFKRTPQSYMGIGAHFTQCSTASIIMFFAPHNENTENYALLEGRVLIGLYGINITSESGYCLFKSYFMTLFKTEAEFSWATIFPVAWTSLHVGFLYVKNRCPISIHNPVIAFQRKLMYKITSRNESVRYTVNADLLFFLSLFGHIRSSNYWRC